MPARRKALICQSSRNASSSHHPTLWRVAAYSAPGLPSPHTSFMASPGESALCALFLRAPDHLGLPTLGSSSSSLSSFHLARLRNTRLRRDQAADRTIGVLCRLDAVRQLRVAYVQRVTDFHPLHAQLDVLGDVVRQAAHFHLGQRMLHETARLDARRLADQANGNLHRDLLTRMDLVEVNVQDDRARGMTLQIGRASW